MLALPARASDNNLERSSKLSHKIGFSQSYDIDEEIKEKQDKILLMLDKYRFVPKT
jgi:hypothetical protein